MTVPIRPPDPRVMKALAAYKKQGLNRLADMAGLSQGTGDAVQSFAMGATEPLDVKGALRAARRGIEAWHGSPHKFDKFSLEKIGTGEGAQAYGHGLYFAEARPVAEMYRTQLAPDEITIGGKTVAEKMFYTTGTPRPPMTPEAEIALRWMETPNVEGVRRQLMESLTREAKLAPGSMRGEQMQKALALLDKGGDVSVKQGGGLYRVRLDVSPDELLDWDKPLAQQPEKVRKVAQEFGMDATDHGYDELVKEAEAQAKDAFMRWKADPTDDKYREFLRADDDQRKIWNSRASSKSGKDVYQEIGVRGDAEASRRLRERGIPGIRYLDGGSRAAGDGTRNYVIFDPERIQILERLAALGIGGEAVRTMLAQAKAAAQPQQSQPPTLPAVTVGR